MRAAAAATSLVVAGLVTAGCGAPTVVEGEDAGARVDAPARDGGRALDAPATPDTPLPPDSPDAPRLGPPYPIVLAHGFFGFEDFAGTGFITYFYGVRDDLRSHGEPRVYTTVVDPFADSTTRGEALAEQIEAILDETGYARVNIIGHSQGGLDARVVAHLRPELVASVTTVATPHRGSPVSDVVLRLIEDPRLRDLLDALVRAIGAPLYDAVGDETSVFDALAQFSTPGIEAFNADYTDVPGLPYFSVAGRSNSRGVVGPCLTGAEMPTLISRWNFYLDPIDPLFSVPGAVVSERWIGAEINDGLVSVESARWGRFLGCIPADHMDEIGQLLGDGPGFGNAFDHIEFWRDLVAFLRDEGL